MARFNVYNRPRLEAKKYGNILLLWVPYKLIGGIDCLSLLNEMFALGVIWVHFSNLSMTQANGFRLIIGMFWAILKKISAIRARATIWLSR